MFHLRYKNTLIDYSQIKYKHLSELNCNIYNCNFIILIDLRKEREEREREREFYLYFEIFVIKVFLCSSTS